jgi:hypothetical protein
MKTKSCVVFAISIDHGDMLYVLHEFVMLLKYRFSDCKIFVGINYNSHPDVEVILNQSGLDIVMDRLTDSYLHTASDDSAYQLALKLFYADPVRYDIAWFIHTKGGFNGRDVERKFYFHEFFSKRDAIEQKFNELEHLGVYGYRAGEFWVDHSNPVGPHITNDFMRAFWHEGPKDDFTCSLSKAIIVETMFALNASLMYRFLDRYNEEFFTSKLRRYFFETEISNLLSSRSGYYQGIVTGNWATGASMDPIIDQWVQENQLIHLENYKNLIKL